MSDVSSLHAPLDRCEATILGPEPTKPVRGIFSVRTENKGRGGVEKVPRSQSFLRKYQGMVLVVQFEPIGASEGMCTPRGIKLQPASLRHTSPIDQSWRCKVLISMRIGWKIHIVPQSSRLDHFI